MINLDHPMTQHVFRASGLMDEVMIRGQRMSVAPSTVRAELLAECLPKFAQMRELAITQFSMRAEFIAAAVDDDEAAIRTLADLGGGRIAEDCLDGTGSCSVCGTAIAHYPEHRIVLCPECDKPFMRAYDKLDSSEGFGT